MNVKTIGSLILGGSVALGLQSALAQTPFAGEDFDGGTTNGGFTAVTEVFTPDNSVNPGGADDPADDGTFSSGFDLFGETSRNDDNTPGKFVPFDLVDDSAGTFAADRLGIMDSTKTDRVVAIGDTENGDNSGPVTAEWTFDITGRSNIELSIDMALTGTHNSSDLFQFSYSIDGGGSNDAFLVQIDPDAADPVYTVTMESGAEYDRYQIPAAFFDETGWTFVANGTPGPGFDFHPDDADQDGFVDLTGPIDGTVATRAYQETNSNGTFNTTEFELFANQLIVNGETALGKEFQTVTSPISGSGTTLTLTLTALSDGSLKYYAFDNILLSEGEATALDGDFNEDGSVDAVDYAVWREGLGGEFTSADFDAWIANYGASAPGAVATPEPTTLLLAALVGLGLSTRRRA